MVTVCSCVCVCVCVCVFPGSAGDGEGLTVENVLSVGVTVDLDERLGLVLDSGQADVQTCTPLQVSNEEQHAPI